MSVEYMLGFGVGILFVGCVVLLLSLWLKKKKPEPCRYDERQQAARGKAFESGFFTMLIYNVICAVIAAGFGTLFMDTTTMMFVGVFLGLTVFCCKCIWEDAYMALNERPRSVYCVLGIIGAVNLVIGFMNLAHGDMIENGQLNIRSTNFLCGIMMLIVLVVFMIKQKKNAADAE